MVLESSASTKNWLRKALLSRVQSVELHGESGRIASIIYAAWTVLDVLTVVYCILWTAVSALGRNTNCEIPPMFSIIVELSVHLLTFRWARRNWAWIQKCIVWKRRGDNLSFCIVCICSLLNVVDPVVYGEEIASDFPAYFRPFSVFFEFYLAFFISLFSGVFYFAIDKIIVALAENLRRIHACFSVVLSRRHQSAVTELPQNFLCRFISGEIARHLLKFSICPFAGQPVCGT